MSETCCLTFISKQLFLSSDIISLICRFSFLSCFTFSSVVILFTSFLARFAKLTANGSRLCVVADLDALHCQPTKMLIRCTKLQFCTEPAITQNRCCAFVVLFCPLYSRSILLLLGSHTLCQVLVCVSARATWQCVWLVGWF